MLQRLLELLLFSILISTIVIDLEAHHGSSANNNHSSQEIYPYLILETNDTLLTGVANTINGTSIQPTKRPKTRNVGKLESVASKSNVHRITGITPKNISKSPIKNRLGKNGIKLPESKSIKGRIVEMIQPEPVSALSPRFRDAATINLQYLDIDQGMNSSYAWFVEQDKQGNLWVATYGGGLSRYDGSTFIHYTENEGLSNNFVQSMIIDRQGNIWLGTFEGINMFDGETIVQYRQDDGLINNSIRSLHEDHLGNIWFGTEGGLGRLSRTGYNEGTVTYFTTEEGLSNDFIRCIIQDSKNNLFFGTDNGLNMFDLYNHDNQLEKASFTHYTTKNSLTHDLVYSLIEDNQGNIWCGTNGGGLNKLSYGDSDHELPTVLYYSEKNGLSNDRVWGMFQDSHQNIWFGTYGGGVSKYSINDKGIEYFTNYSENEGLSNNFVMDIYEDDLSNIWLATYGGGINVLDYSSVFQHFMENEGLSNRYVLSIYEDREKNIWFGTEGGGANKFSRRNDNYYFTHFDKESGLGDDVVRSVYEDKYSNIWFGTNSGAIQYSPKNHSYKHFGLEEGLSDEWIRSIFGDDRDNIWFGSDDLGVFRYSQMKEEFTQYSIKEGLGVNAVSSILKGPNGAIWLGTYGAGLCRYTNIDGKETFTHFTENEGLSNNYITSLLLDSDGLIWIGTESGGVNIFDINSLKFEFISEEEGLCNNYVWSIVTDFENNYWVSTENGISKIIFNGTEKTEDKKLDVKGSYSIENYGRKSGLKAPDFFATSGLADSHNRIWWGGGKALTMLDLNQPTPPPYVPKIQLNHIEINDEFVDYRRLKNDAYQNQFNFGQDISSSFSSTPPFYNYPLNLALPHDIKHIAFNYSAIDLSGAKVTGYQFILEGFDETWSTLTTETTAGYRNLSFGNYTFKVRSQSINGLWSETFSYSFMIQRPWWYSWWLVVIYPVILLILIIGLIRWRTANYKLQKMVLETKVAQRNSELLESKRELENSLEKIVKTQNKLIQSEKMASLGQLSAGIAHELNNPISAVYTGSIALERDLDDLLKILKRYASVENELKAKTRSDLKNYKEELDYNFLIESVTQTLKHLKIGAERTTQIVKGLSSFSRLDSDKRLLADIHEGLRNTVLLLNNQVKDRINIKMDFDSKITKISCFYGQLNQVFMNLLTNSIDAIGGEGEITITTRLIDHNVIISIKDNGTGMNRVTRQRIFDPFFTTKDVGSGTGLGLSITHGIIEKHGGTIDVISEMGKGTEFIITLPIEYDQSDSEKKQ